MPIHVLGPFRLDTKIELLFRGGEPVGLGRRAVALLRALVERPGVIVPKDALMEAAWPGQIVEDSNLTVQIAAVRRVLGEVLGGEQWIETMPRRGYRFVGHVVSEDGGGHAAPVVEPNTEHCDGPLGAAERRPITAMSCELIGASGRLDDIGLEVLRSAVGAFQRCVAETAKRHDGFVVSQLGTGALVLFGYPSAHEHDAEQAVRAGTALCAAIRALGSGADVALACRAGIATSVSIIGGLTPNGGPEEREIVGDAPNLAAQLRLLAPPDVVAIEPVTRGLIGTLFDCRALGPIVTAGFNEPIPVWQVLGDGVVASRFEALRGPALTRLVGRDEEIALLMRRWARATAGEGQVVLVSGEPGIGKSRLTAAMEARLADEAHGRLQYFCSPHRQDSALFPFADQLGRSSGFARDDSSADRLAKLKVLLAEAAVPDADVALLADLLALPVLEHDVLTGLSPQRKKQRTLEALLRVQEGLARQQPMVVIFEDAHWMDATSRELLDLAVEHVRGLPILLIVTFRPEFKPPWTGQAHVTMLALNRLDRRDRIALAAHVADKALPDSVLAQIADRTDGVPLFVEEITKSVMGLLRAGPDRYVLDGTLPSLAIPTSLYASLLARLDHPASVRLVAQAGAAIGREFPYGLLRAVAGLPDTVLEGALGRLVASELVFQRGVAPEAVYRFKHALVQDVAYDSLLREARQRLHAGIAHALEAQSPELLETQPELFAQHYAEAGLVEKSVAAWARAGQRSAARSALAEAAAQYQKALDQLALQPESPERLRQELDFRSALGALLRFVKGQAAPETGEAYARTRALWEQLGSPPAFRHVPYGQSMCHVYRGELDLAQRVGEELLDLSRTRDDTAGMVLGHSATGQSLMLAGQFGGSRPHFEALLGLYDPDAHATLVHQTGSHPLMTQAFLGLALFCLGFPEQAMARTEAAIADARRLAHPTSLAVGLAIGALLGSLAGDHAGAGQRADQLAWVADEQGMPFFRAWGAIYRGRSRIGLGDVTGGMSLLAGGVAAYRDTGSVMWLPHFVALLSAGHEAAGQIEAALALMEEAMQTVARTGECWFAAELNRQSGRLFEQQGRPDTAEALYHRALGIAREQDARLWELRSAMSLARLRCAQGRVAEADDLLGPICGWFTEGLATPDLLAAKSLLDRLQAGPTATDAIEAGGGLLTNPLVAPSPLG